MLVSSLSGPDYTSAGTRGIETGVRLVAFVGSTELPVHGRADLLSFVSSASALAFGVGIKHIVVYDYASRLYKANIIKGPMRFSLDKLNPCLSFATHCCS
jgi:hypothetical protein